MSQTVSANIYYLLNMGLQERHYLIFIHIADLKDDFPMIWIVSRERTQRYEITSGIMESIGNVG